MITVLVPGRYLELTTSNRVSNRRQSELKRRACGGRLSTCCRCLSTDEHCFSVGHRFLPVQLSPLHPSLRPPYLRPDLLYSFSSIRLSTIFTKIRPSAAQVGCSIVLVRLCPVGSISNLDTSGPCLLSPLPRPRRSSLLAICPQLSYEPASSVVFVCSWPSLKHNNNYARSVANIRPGPFQATGPLAESPQPARRGR